MPNDLTTRLAEAEAKIGGKIHRWEINDRKDGAFLIFFEGSYHKIADLQHRHWVESIVFARNEVPALLHEAADRLSFLERALEQATRAWTVDQDPFKSRTGWVAVQSVYPDLYAYLKQQSSPGDKPCKDS